VAAVIGLVALVPTLSAGATPNLPPLTAAQLIDKVQKSNVQALSGSIRLSANLALPDLGSLAGAAGRGSGFNPVDLLSGSHDARVWFDGPDRQRVALLSPLAESDLIHNGQDVWTWVSQGSKVTHSHTAGATVPAEPRTSNAALAETPDQVATMLLGELSPSTDVSVGTTARVADRSAYELVLRPRTAPSTVDHIGIAIDAKTGLPLQVALFAKDHSKAALQLGFTSVTFARPAASTFAFRPPPGANVTTNAGTPNSGGPNPAARFVPPRVKAPAQAEAPNEVPQATTGADGPKVVGQDWAQVIIFPAANQVPSPVTARPGEAANNLTDQLYRLRRAATPIKGTNDRLLHTALVNVLLLADGRIAVGAVTPDALEAVASAH
jgi:outer membrane lipoprotein-sorting protein